MIMKRFIYVIALILFFGCNTTKKVVKTDIETQVETKAKTEHKTDVKTDIKVVSQVNENVFEKDTVLITETVVELSKPDSSGKQYTEKIINRTITSAKQKQTETKTNNETVVKAAQSNVIKADITQKQHENISVDEKTVVKRLSWLKLLNVFLICGLFVGLYFVVRKFVFK